MCLCVYIYADVYMYMYIYADVHTIYIYICTWLCSKWTESTCVGSDLNGSDLEKQYPSHIYKHNQHPPTNTTVESPHAAPRDNDTQGEVDASLIFKKQDETEMTLIDAEAATSKSNSRENPSSGQCLDADDHCSPISPEEYIIWRLKPAMEFYQVS